MKKYIVVIRIQHNSPSKETCAYHSFIVDAETKMQAIGKAESLLDAMGIDTHSITDADAQALQDFFGKEIPWID